MQRPTEPAFLLLLLAVASGACNDPSFISVEAPEAGPRADAGAEGGFGLAACEACLMTPDTPGPGCQTETQACQALSDCAMVIPCIESTGCFGMTQSEFITCALPCGSTAGISGAAGPGFMSAVTFFGCVTGACKPVCLAP